MISPIGASNLRGSSQTLYYEDVPDECPICHMGISPQSRIAVFSGPPNTPESRLQILFQCTRQSCEKLFIGTYKYRYDTSNSTSHNLYYLTSTAPTTPEQEDFGSLVEGVSPTFVEIYNQAVAAEAMDLEQLSGMGLRKAIEFLIKDFIADQNPNNVEEVRAMPLGRCINEHVDDPNVKACAKRAVWLGNDETHYTRKWADRDINDLKVLTKLTVNWIENVLLTQQYVEDMAE